MTRMTPERLAAIRQINEFLPGVLVTELLEELDAVRGERDYAQNIATMHLATIDTLTRERDEARRENERLKAAIDSDGSLAADGDFDAYLGIAIDGAHALDTLPTIVERQDKEIRSLQKQLAASPPVTAPPERAPGEREALETALTAVRPQLLDMHYYAMGEYADTHPALQDRIEDDVDAVLDNIRSAFAAHQERANTPAALTRAGAGGEGDENI